MPDISMKEFLEAGVHFGHQRSRWNPKMKKYIFDVRDDIHIIDLQKTVDLAKEACAYVKQLTAQGQKILFVATKKQAQEVVKSEATRAKMFYVVERWLGGTLTNFKTIRTGINNLKRIEDMEEKGIFDILPKKEVSGLKREREKLLKAFSGIRDMKKLPGALFVLDPSREHIAVKEANKLGIPVVAVVDTNCNPDSIQCVIPGNDDATKAIRLFSSLIADACLEGLQEFEKNLRGEDEKPTEEETEEASVLDVLSVREEPVVITPDQYQSETPETKKGKEEEKDLGTDKDDLTDEERKP